ncbi:tRNA (adenosine(37)-N6)-threonylcarbamoyltransferase complex dimerization subunit type 1 TsaB [Paenibacillus sp. J22TS3]|uniref:tRNA (adenosine(37)-N6)-threonylcarbamoyltransferase complex dimerization subunit type 1 TsaB n=1 Tax=Paenibacillus sp. J22TS3 TaxID=2807192 RepID=UPI001B29E9DD|nr:tRNA (adenosine(37)-N6)-threonylcarbamoyltransferase complex dimerization subunit type 1 TsaB [Paenibacillus sp. J22TS3]GIP22701.1 tRNA (adenosine(37)-N6)-threonylcarbamoyltransferase complex dimerization subunit type 1 TsaB [Paenibacillus sp. J22TS3]
MSEVSKSTKYTLAFDSSTASLAVAVMNGGDLLAERNITAERNHSVHLITAIEEALGEAGVRKSELSGIAAGVGPGSYTGIRIAVTTAKTLAWSMALPVAGISSLAALGLGGWAEGTDQPPAAFAALAGSPARQGTAAGEQAADGSAPAEWIIPLVDARRGQVYTALFEAAPGKLPRRLEPDGIRLMERWTAALAGRLEALAPEARPSAVWFTGETALHAEAAEALRPLLGGRLQIRPHLLQGAWAGLLGADRLLRGESDEVHSLVPNYTQLSEAEANLARGK